MHLVCLWLFSSLSDFIPISLASRRSLHALRKAHERPDIRRDWAGLRADGQEFHRQEEGQTRGHRRWIFNYVDLISWLLIHSNFNFFWKLKLWSWSLNGNGVDCSSAVHEREIGCDSCRTRAVHRATRRMCLEKEWKEQEWILVQTLSSKY